MMLIKKCQAYIENAELKVKAIIDGKIEDYDLENQKVIPTSKIEQFSTSNNTQNQEDNDDLPF